MSAPCECCASPLGERVSLRGVSKIVCDQCLGFIYRWLLDIENTNRPMPVLGLNTEDGK